MLKGAHICSVRVEWSSRERERPTFLVFLAPNYHHLTNLSFISETLSLEIIKSGYFSKSKTKLSNFLYENIDVLDSMWFRFIACSFKVQIQMKMPSGSGYNHLPPTLEK